MFNMWASFYAAYTKYLADDFVKLQNSGEMKRKDNTENKTHNLTYSK